MSCKAEKCMSFGQDEMCLFVENKSLHFPLTGGGAGGLPVLIGLDGVKLTSLDLAGGLRTTGVGEGGGSGLIGTREGGGSGLIGTGEGGEAELIGTGEDGRGDVAYSSSEQEKLICSSSRSSLVGWSASRDPSSAVFVPEPLAWLTTGRGGRSALEMLEPANKAKADLIPRNVVGGDAGTCERLTDADFLLLFAI